MAAVSSIFLVLSLVLAVVIGPQTRPWTWGPAMLAMGLSAAAALPEFWRKSRNPSDFGLLALGLLVAGWFAWRAWISPVVELGQADLLLLAGAVGAFISVRVIEGNEHAERILMWGIALLLLANVAVVGKQVFEPSYSPVFRSRVESFPSGLYAHYNEAANYLIASSLMVGAAALFGRSGGFTRAVWGVIAVCGLVAVYYTRSRGGILGAAVGGGVFACAALVVGKRSGAKWFSPALVALPVIGLGIAMFLYSGWKGSQELRNAEVGIEKVLDSNYRLYFLGLAVSCIGLHPLAGGGSRSFSWENFRFSGVHVQGSAIVRKPEQVHNELLQAATDYGLIGAGLLIGFLGSLALVAVVRLMFSPASRRTSTADAWRVGGLAALAGMFVQSCFSFVFHLFPGVVLLGLCLGLMLRSSNNGSGSSQVAGARIVLSLAIIACAAVLLPFGWKGTQVTRTLWPVYFSKSQAVVGESRIDALAEAIRVWPQSGFYQERGALYQAAAALDGNTESDAAAQRAIDDFREAARLHPYDPGFAVNLANLLSHRKRDDEAEAAYERAIQLQGGMEPAFHAHISLADHLMRKGHRIFSPGDPAPALAALEVAAQAMEKSVHEMQWAAHNIYNARVTIHESLGAAREANGDYQGAMAAYDFAASAVGGSRAHYRAGILYGKMAAAAWMKRRSAEAMGLFIEARRRILQAAELPVDVTPSQRDEYVAYLDRTIEYFRGAKFEPLPVPQK